MAHSDARHIFVYQNLFCVWCVMGADTAGIEVFMPILSLFLSLSLSHSLLRLWLNSFGFCQYDIIDCIARVFRSYVMCVCLCVDVDTDDDEPATLRITNIKVFVAFADDSRLLCSVQYSCVIHYCCHANNLHQLQLYTNGKSKAQ